MSIVLDLQPKSLPRFSVQTNRLELIKEQTQVMKINKF